MKTPEPILHGYSNLASQTMSWLAPDTEDAYKKNLASNNGKKWLTNFGWVDTEISYKFNSHAFRGAEFSKQPNFVALGCSFTFGLGVNETESWPSYLSELQNLHVWNLGVPGSSGDTCYRIAKHYVPVLRPKFVVMLEPRYNRIELIDADTTYPHTINLAHNMDPWGKGLYIKRWLLNEENMELHAEKNQAAIAYICKQLNIPIFVFGPNDFINLTPVETHDLGRDCLHAGRKNNRAFAEVVHRHITNTL
jgi:hypothetical protein